MDITSLCFHKGAFREAEEQGVEIGESMNRSFRRAFDAEQRRQPDKLTNVHPNEWPAALREYVRPPLEVWRSKTFLVQLFKEPPNSFRLTVNRAALDDAGGWGAQITWDELQAIKSECGYGNCWAVECFPPDSEVINVANMRHLWLLGYIPAFGWKRGEPR